MKKVILSLSIVVAWVLAINNAKAQFSVSLNVGVPVAVAPEPVDPYYDDAGYYYYPDINCYYDVGASCYWYWYGNRWLYSRGIPACYRGYDFYRHRTMLNRTQFYSRGLPFARGGYRGGGYGRNRGGYAYNRGYGYNRRGNVNYQANHFQSRGAFYNHSQFQQRGNAFQNRGGNINRGGNGNMARGFSRGGGGGHFGHHGR